MKTIDLSPNRSSWEDIAGRPTPYSVFPIWAEENADVGTYTAGGTQWSFGNGNNSPSGTGVCVPFDCELFALTISMERADTVTVEAEVNAVSTGISVSATAAKSAFANYEGGPFAVLAGDVLGFRTLAPDRATSSDGAVVTAWLRRLQA